MVVWVGVEMKAYAEVITAEEGALLECRGKEGLHDGAKCKYY